MLLTKEKLEELKQRINQHFLNELIIMSDMIEAELTKEEVRELNKFMNSHPYDAVVMMLEKKVGQ